MKTQRRLTREEIMKYYNKVKEADKIQELTEQEIRMKDKIIDYAFSKTNKIRDVGAFIFIAITILGVLISMAIKDVWPFFILIIIGIIIGINIDKARTNAIEQDIISGRIKI